MYISFHCHYGGKKQQLFQVKFTHLPIQYSAQTPKVSLLALFDCIFSSILSKSKFYSGSLMVMNAAVQSTQKWCIEMYFSRVFAPPFRNFRLLLSLSLFFPLPFSLPLSPSLSINFYFSLFLSSLLVCSVSSSLSFSPSVLSPTVRLDNISFNRTDPPLFTFKEILTRNSALTVSTAAFFAAFPQMIF